MKIRTLEYHDKRFDWHLNPVDFSGNNLTLLVGVSGVGKTLILNSIRALKTIADGFSLNGVKWNVTFSIESNLIYCWEGEFETKKKGVNETEEQFKIVYEKLSSNQSVIIERDSSKIILKGKETPKLSPFQSAITILNREEVIEPIYKALRNIAYSGISDWGFISEENSIIMRAYKSLKDIRNSGLRLKSKLLLSCENIPEIFEKIRQHFIEIFPYTEDIKIEPDRKEEFTSFSVQIKEKGVMNWIEEGRLSSGMLRVLRHLSELYLLPEGSVLLIDEFENSLGINCIDALTENLSEDRNLQFIITSHHPYIINNIAMEHWKIVTRKGNTVTVRDASDFKLGKTKHSAFMELLQLEEYSDGIQ
jgi:predicted ATPase